MGPLLVKKRKKTWKVVLLYLFQTLWQERNKRAIDNYESIDHTIKNSFWYLF